MFSNDLDRRRDPLKSRFWGVLLGTIVMIAVPLAVVNPNTLTMSLPVLFAALIVAAYLRGGFQDVKPQLGTVSASGAAFLSYAALSALWAERPMTAIGWPLLSAVTALCCGIAVRSFLSEPRRNILHIGEGVWVGMIAGLAYLAVEILSHQWIKISLFNYLHLGPEDLKPRDHFFWDGARLTSISASDLTKNIAPIPSIIWAVLLTVRGTLAKRTGWIVWAAILALTIAVVAISENETAKMALAGGTLIFTLAKYKSGWSERLLQAGWIIACLAIVPISLAMYRANFHNASWAQASLQHRFIIWNRTAEEAMKAPLLGIGTGMTYWKYDTSDELHENEKYPRNLRDVHNAYLQTWFELGVIGATLLCLFGLAVVQRFRTLPEQIVPYAHATFVSVAATIASTWGMWRPWFVCTFAFAVVLFAIGIRTMIRNEHASGAPATLA